MKPIDKAILTKIRDDLIIYKRAIRDINDEYDPQNCIRLDKLNENLRNAIEITKILTED